MRTGACSWRARRRCSPRCLFQLSNRRRAGSEGEGNLQAVARDSLFTRAGTGRGLPRAPGHGGERCCGETARQTPQDDPASLERLWVSLADLCQEAEPVTLYQEEIPLCLGPRSALAHGILTRDLSGRCPYRARKPRPSVGNSCLGSRLAPESLFPALPRVQPSCCFCSCSLLSSGNAYTVGASPVQGKEGGNQPYGEGTVM